MQRHVTKFFSTLLSSRPAVVSPPDMPDGRGFEIVERIRSLLDLNQEKRLHEIIHKKHQTYGPTFRGRIGPNQAVFTSSPNAIQQVFRLEGRYPQHYVPQAWLMYNEMRQRKRGLLFMDGEEWHRYRKILNRVMVDRSNTNFMAGHCQDAAENLVDKWKGYMAKNQIIPNLENELYQWSIEVLLATMVGKPWPAYRRKILPRIEKLSRGLSQIFDHSTQVSRWPNLDKYFGLPAWRGMVAAFDQALESVDAIVEGMIELEGAESGLLRRMMDEGMEKHMLQRIVADLVVAAGDTTAYSMLWLLFLLTKNQNSQEKIANSLRGLSVEETLHEPLLRGAMKESLRLYPIATFLTRILPEDVLLDGYPVYKGELVVLSFYSSSRDESNFPQPDAFVPERWSKDANNKGCPYSSSSVGVINHHASLPFSMGARSCVGKRLAEIQMSLTTAELLKHFVIDCPNKDRITMRLRMIPAPSEPLQLRLNPRR